MMEIRLDHGDLEDLTNKLLAFSGKTEQAAARSINRTLTSTRALMVRLVREDYAVKAKAVRGALSIDRATPSDLTGRVMGVGPPGIPLIEFVRGSKKAPSTRRLKSGAYRPLIGVPVIVRKDRGKVPAKGVFIAKMRSGHVGAFKRTVQSSSARRISSLGNRYIKEAYGPHPIKILASERYDREITEFASATMEKNMRHEVGYMLMKLGLS